MKQCLARCLEERWLSIIDPLVAPTQGRTSARVDGRLDLGMVVLRFRDFCFHGLVHHFPFRLVYLLNVVLIRTRGWFLYSSEAHLETCNLISQACGTRCKARFRIIGLRTSGDTFSPLELSTFLVESLSHVAQGLLKASEDGTFPSFCLGAGASRSAGGTSTATEWTRATRLRFAVPDFFMTSALLSATVFARRSDVACQAQSLQQFPLSLVVGEDVYIFASRIQLQADLCFVLYRLVSPSGSLLVFTAC